MELIDRLYFCFGIPLMGLFLYYKLAGKIENETVFYIGFFNTFNLSLWFAEIFTIIYWGISALHVLGFVYLLVIAPMCAIGCSYWIFIRRAALSRYFYSLITSASYVLFFWGLPLALLGYAAYRGSIFSGH